MLSKRLLSHFSFLVVGLLSVVLAVYLASPLLKSSHSQDSTDEATVLAPASPSAPQAAVGSTESAAPSSTTSLTPSIPLESSSAAAAAAVTDDLATPLPLAENVSFLEPYIFDLREGRRNPFRVPTLADGTLADMMLPGTPLERYDLNELKLVGIMWDIHAPKAMLVDPQGEVHVLGKDDRIGRKRGYIAVIREGEVVVVETSNFNGENTYATRVMRIDR